MSAWVPKLSTRILSIFFLCVALCACTGLFFHPSEQSFPVSEALDGRYEDVWFKGKAGALHGWWLAASTDQVKGTVFFAHGNAENLRTHVHFVHWLLAFGYNVFIYDYRGYGRSEGSPSAQGLIDDTVSAYTFISNRAEVQQLGIVAYGHSLGGTTLIHALAQIEDLSLLKGVIIDSSFAGFRRIARDKVRSHWMTRWLSPFMFALIPTSLSAADDIRKIKNIPIAITHSEHDRVIPFEHGQFLFENALEPKTFYTLHTAFHNHGWRLLNDRTWFLEQLARFWGEK